MIRRSLKQIRLFSDGLIAERRLRREIDLVRTHASEALPHFLIVGAPKCGTSWLAGALRRHPRVLMAPNEIEYFSSHLDRPLVWYLDHFRQWGHLTLPPEAGEAFVTGEKSAGYSGLSLSRIRLVHRLLPDVRLILMIRDR